jgi:excisionase family DNA binding protein
LNKEVATMGVIELKTELLRVEEAAKVLGIGRTKAYEMIAAGELPVVRIRRAVRVPRKSLEEWISTRTEYPSDSVLRAV